MEHPMTVYLRKRSPEQHYWSYLADCPERIVPMALRELIRRERTFVGAETARYVLDWLHEEGFRDNHQGNTGTPVEVVDYDGNPVELRELSPVACPTPT
jgi:hypothetical protein